MRGPPRRLAWWMFGLGALVVPGCYLSHQPPVDCDAGILCGACFGGACDYATGEGCPASDACHIRNDPTTGAAETYCVPSAHRPIGAPCATAADCASGVPCVWQVVERPPGFCMPLCCPGESCPSGMHCEPLSIDLPDGGTTPLPRAGFCSWNASRCDLIGQTGCPRGLACYAAPLGTCLPPGHLPAGAPCEALGDCAPRLSCIAEESGDRICRHLCYFDRDCGAGQHCERPPGGVGICRP